MREQLRAARISNTKVSRGDWVISSGMVSLPSLSLPPRRRRDVDDVQARIEEQPCVLVGLDHDSRLVEVEAVGELQLQDRQAGLDLGRRAVGAAEVEVDVEVSSSGSSSVVRVVRGSSYLLTK